MPNYEYYAAVDENFNFPPEVLAALVKAQVFGDAVPDTGTPLGAAIANLIGQGGGIQGQAGVKTGIFSGVIVAQPDGTWKIDSSVTGKSRSLNLDSVQNVVAFEDNSGVNVKVNFANLKGTRLVAAFAHLETPSGGYRVALPVTSPTSVVFSFGQDIDEISDYVYYDPTINNWRSSFGWYIPKFAGGYLTLEHISALPASVRDRLSVTPRGNKFRYNVSTDPSPTNGKGILVEVRENEPAIDAFIQYDGTKFVSSNSDKIQIGGWYGTDGKLVLQHAALSGASDDRVALAQRGPLQPSVSVTSGPLSARETHIQFYSNGALVKDLSQEMRFYIQRGGSTGLAPTPSADMKLFVRHGGGSRYVAADDIAKTEFPGARVAIFGIVEKA